MVDNQWLLEHIDDYQWTIDQEIKISKKEPPELFKLSLNWLGSINAEIRGTIESKFIRVKHDYWRYDVHYYGWDPRRWDKIIYIVITESQNVAYVRILIRPFILSYPEVLDRSMRWWYFLVEDFYDVIGYTISLEMLKSFYPYEELLEMRFDMLRAHPKDGKLDYFYYPFILMLISIGVFFMRNLWGLLFLIIGFVSFYDLLQYYLEIQEKMRSLYGKRSGA